MRKMMMGAALLAAALSPNAAAAAPLRAYIGTYTPDAPKSSNHGQGIYMVAVDAATGTLGAPRLVAKTPSPSWIALDPRQKFLYAANETAAFNGTPSGSVSAYAIDPASGALKFLNTVSSQGANPAHLSVHPSGRFVLVANYTGGSVAVLPVKPDGSLGEAVDMIHPQGKLNPPHAADNPPGDFGVSDHSASHVHMVAADPSGKFVIANDAGLDKVLVWRIDLATGKLAQVSVTDSLPGSAPRHFVFDAGGRHFYDLLEQDSMLAAYDFDSATGKLTPKQKLSALPAGYAGSNLSSELLISRDGRHLYAANRLSDTIATFAVDAVGHVSQSGTESTRADYPRSLALDPSGRFLYAMNQLGDSVTKFRIDPMTGLPHFDQQYLPVGSPTVMVFTGR